MGGGTKQVHADERLQSLNKLVCLLKSLNLRGERLVGGDPRRYLTG
jgi:hypothetical protein